MSASIPCAYLHVATNIVTDFSAINLELKDVLDHAFKRTVTLSQKRGGLEVRSEFARLLDTKEEWDDLERSERYGF